jgi:molecular chaperone DnaJ
MAPGRWFPIHARLAGAGRLKHTQNAVGEDPSGVDQDDRIRLSGEGEGGMNGGPSGDLYVVVSPKAHPYFSAKALTCTMKCRQLRDGARR